MARRAASKNKKRRMAAADVAAILRREIVDGRRMGNERLPPTREFSESFGVARNTLRSALVQLEQEGLVRIRPGSGTYVVGRSDSVEVEYATPLELIDARFALEPHVCRLAVLHGRREDFERLGALCDQMEGSASAPVRFAEADEEFHRRLAAATRNGLIASMSSRVNAIRSMKEWTQMRRLTLEPDIIRTYNSQHRRILDAVAARDSESAAAAMKEHLETARLSLTRVLET